MTEENPRILCVDDDLPVLKLLEDMLAPRHFDVITAGNAEQAIERFSNNRIDIVLTDIMMPAVSGIDLLEKIHAFSPETPVILMTSFADMEKAIQAVKKEAFDFLIKPFKWDQLVGSLEKALRFRRLSQMETDYKRMLEDFNQQIETLVAERTMSLMALTVADRVRNPAYVIEGICRRLAEREEMSAKVREGMELIGQETGKLNKIVDEFQDLLKSKRSLISWLAGSHVGEVIDEANKRHIPVISAGHVDYQHGLVMSYAPSDDSAGSQAARLAHKILQGTSPAYLPVENAEVFLGINLRAARSAGLEIPETVLRRADFLIR